MLKNKKKVTLVSLITTIIMCSVILTACQSKGKPIKLPSDEEIVKLQIHAFRFDGEKYKDSYNKRLKFMKEGIEQTEPISKREAEKHPMGEETYTVGFFYKDGKKEFFKFYKDGEEWFMKTEAGDVYANAGFVAGHVEPEDATDVEKNEESIQYQFSISPEILSYGEQTDFDLRFLFANAMNEYLQNKTFDEALYMTKDRLRGGLFLYQYALDNGCQATEEELQKGYLFSYLLPEKDREEYEKQLAVALQKAGVSKEIYDKEVRAEDEMALAVVKLQEKKRQEFLEGKDMLEGEEYYSAGEYWDIFLNKLLISAFQNDEHKDIMDKVDQDLAKAEQAYLKDFGK